MMVSVWLRVGFRWDQHWDTTKQIPNPSKNHKVRFATMRNFMVKDKATEKGESTCQAKNNRKRPATCCTCSKCNPTHQCAEDHVSPKNCAIWNEKICDQIAIMLEIRLFYRLPRHFRLFGYSYLRANAMRLFRLKTREFERLKFCVTPFRFNCCTRKRLKCQIQPDKMKNTESFCGLIRENPLSVGAGGLAKRVPIHTTSATNVGHLFFHNQACQGLE